MTNYNQTKPQVPTVRCSSELIKECIAAGQIYSFPVGGFCNCDDGHKARDIPERTKLLAEARLNCLITGDGKDRVADFAYTKGDGQLYVSIDFYIVTLEFEGQWVNYEIHIGAIADWPNFTTEPLVLSQMLNSAANVFSRDTTIVADELRAEVVSEELGQLRFVNELTVAIEVGRDANDTEWNCVAKIVEPDDPDYVRVMSTCGVTTAGVGIWGDHKPPSLTSDAHV